MKIGMPKEIKNNEFRVGLTPSAVKELVTQGHSVIVEHHAGDANSWDQQLGPCLSAGSMPFRGTGI